MLGVDSAALSDTHNIASTFFCQVLLEGRLGKASDVYAFAITLYELFTGGMAYQGENSISHCSNALLAFHIVGAGTLCRQPHMLLY